MNNFIEKISDVVGPIAEKMSRLKYLNALAETMQILIPITILGSFATLFAFLEFEPWQNVLAAYPAIAEACMMVQSCTLTIISLYLVIILPLRYSEHLGLKEGIGTVPLAIVSFLLITPINLYESIPMTWLGHAGMFVAMFVGYAVPRICKLFIDKNITIRMPAGVPQIVSSTFTVLVPGVALIIMFSIVRIAFGSTSFGDIHTFVYNMIQEPFKNVALSFPTYMLFGALLPTIFMFCGIHGSTAASWLTPFITAASNENLAALSSGQPFPNIIAGNFTDYGMLGGYGATLGLGILLLFISRSTRLKQLSRMAIVPQIFNIGEPLLFGIPIMLNPILFIPYIGGVLVNVFVSYFATVIGIVGRYTGMNPGWTVPAPIGAFLGSSTPIASTILMVVLIIVDMLIWYPFIRLVDKRTLDEELASEAEAAAKAQTA